jgi:hypothetical protein
MSGTVVAAFLAPHVGDDGYAGLCRNEHEPFPTLPQIEGGKPQFRDLAERPKPFGFNG